MTKSKKRLALSKAGNHQYSLEIDRSGQIFAPSHSKEEPALRLSEVKAALRVAELYREAEKLKNAADEAFGSLSSSTSGGHDFCVEEDGSISVGCQSYSYEEVVALVKRAKTLIGK